MRRLAAIAAAVAGALAVGLNVAGARAPQDPGAERALPPASFAFAIGDGMLAGGSAEVSDRLGEFDLVVIDGELARAGEVAALRGRGATVLAYLSVGTIERWRSWFRELKRFRLEAWRDWEDEWFADASRAAYRRKIIREIAPEILAKGFDGLFLDNVDMIEAGRHRRQRPGMRRLVLALSRLARADGGMLFAQNGRRGLGKLGLLDALDGWNREDVTWTYDFEKRRYVRNKGRDRRAALRELRELGDRGLIVTATDYTRRGDRKALSESVANACAAGALPYVSDIGLTARRLPAPPLTCPP